MTPEIPASSRPLRPTQEILLAAGALAAGVALCLPSLAGLGRLWSSSEFYGHAYAIPAVAAYLVWQGRDALRDAVTDLRPPLWGAPLVLAAGLLEALMVMGDAGFLAAVMFPVVMASVAFATGGRRLLQPLILPLAFLMLMVPPPHFVRYELLFRLKLLVTEIGVGTLQFLGATVTAEGNQILIPNHTLFVADACSGLTSIVTLLPLSCIVAYFLTHGVWRRAVVIASVVPLAMIANVIRVVATVMLVSSHGVEFAQGMLHESFGLATYVVGTLSLVGIAKVLR